MNEDMNELLDNLIATIQCDYLVEHPEIVGREVTHETYLIHMAETLSWAGEYLGLVSHAYAQAHQQLLQRLEAESTPLQERIDKALGIKK